MRPLAQSRKTARDSRTIESQLSNWLKRLCDVALMGVIFAAPLFMGGRGAVGKFVIVALVGVAAISWFLRQCLVSARWRWSGAEILILLGGLLVLLQLLPLPQSLLFTISPVLRDWLPLWQADAPIQLGVWSTISLTPEDTRGGLSMYLAYALFFLVLVQRIENLRDVQFFVKCLALAAIGMACVGMLQLVFGNGKFLWIYHHPTRDTFDKVNGTFQNQNHFAHFLALGVGPIIWWLHQYWTATGKKGPFKSSSRGKGPSLEPIAKNLLTIGGGIVAVASLLTFSRGGILCVALVALITTIIYWQKSLLGRKGLAAFGAFSLVVCLAMAIYGYQHLSTRMTTLATGSLGKITPVRMDLWKAQWKAIPRFPLFGTGVGSHREVYRVYLERFYDLEFTHGENGYFELLLETGFLGAGLFLFGFACAIRWSWTALRSSNTPTVALAGALLPGLIGSLAHSIGDFVWYISACVTSTLVLVACCCRLDQISRNADEDKSSDGLDRRQPSRDVGTIPLSRLAMLGLTGLLLIGCFVSISSRLGPALAAPHWDVYHRLVALKKRSSAAMNERDSLAAMEAALERVVKYSSKDARAHLLLSALQLKRFEIEQKQSANPMGLEQIRDAALASKFPSQAKQNRWLQVAIGENVKRLFNALHHSHRALRGSPLQGVGYAYMAQLSFLEDPRKSTIQHYVQQAYRVRPHSGLVLLAIGKEAALAGDSETAIQHWKRAFQIDYEVRAQIVESLAEILPPDFFLQNFEPDLAGLQTLFGYYRDHQRVDDGRQVGQPLVKLLVEQAAECESEEAAELWEQARGVHQYLENLQGAVDCQRRAVELKPSDFERRRSLATLLSQAGQYADSIAALEWCLRRQPDDEALKAELATAKTKLLSTDRSARVPFGNSSKTSF